DHLGTPRVITRPSDNQKVWEWSNTEPFGNSLPNSNPNGLGSFAYNLRFPGQYFDAETGLNYNYFRDYDPSIGPYVQPDPTGLNGSDLSLYSYATQNPLRNLDPTGEFAFFLLPALPAIGEGLLALGGYVAGGAAIAAIMSIPRDSPQAASAPLPEV